MIEGVHAGLHSSWRFWAGGSFAEPEAAGVRLLLDLGLPLDADHHGLRHLAGPGLPVALGRATHRIPSRVAPFVPDARASATAVGCESGRPFRLGPFTIVPHLVDRSACDAHALEVEGAGARLL